MFSQSWQTSLSARDVAGADTLGDHGFSLSKAYAAVSSSGANTLALSRHPSEAGSCTSNLPPFSVEPDTYARQLEDLQELQKG